MCLTKYMCSKLMYYEYRALKKFRTHALKPTFEKETRLRLWLWYFMLWWCSSRCNGKIEFKKATPSGQRVARISRIQFWKQRNELKMNSIQLTEVWFNFWNGHISAESALVLVNLKDSKNWYTVADLLEKSILNFNLTNLEFKLTLQHWLNRKRIH